LKRAGTWLVGLWLVAACKPLPPPGRSDAGLALLTGVTLERMEKDHVQLTLRAPDALLGLDGDRLVLNHVEGTGQQVDGGPVELRALRLEASLARGGALLVDATARDGQGRTLHSARVILQADGGPLLADGPVTLDGPNLAAVAAGGARVDLATQDVELLGPVTARAWPPDAGRAGAQTVP
jgi:hypothetical protein